VALIRAHVLAGARIHGDDTTVPVLAKSKTITGRLWTYVRHDQPFGGPAPRAAVFHYSRDRGGEHPRRHLADYAGILQADAYAGFSDLYERGRRPGPMPSSMLGSRPAQILRAGRRSKGADRAGGRAPDRRPV
jgi:transposase